MLNGSLVGFAMDVSDDFAAGAFCAGALFAGVCALATDAVNITAEKQTTPMDE